MAEEKLSWISVLTFLQNEYSSLSLREKEWQLEKYALNQQIAILQGQLRANQTTCESLMNRIRMLQVCLARERAGRNSQSVKVDIEDILEKKGVNVDKLQEKQHHQFLSRIIDEMGLGKGQSQLQLPPPVQSFSQNRNQLNAKSQNFSNPTEKFKVPAHLDAVTGIHSTVNNHNLITISEDCLVKIWNSNSLTTLNPQPEPVSTLRDHTGPLFSLTGGRHQNEQIIFVGGSQGYIKSWKIKQEAESKNAQKFKIQTIFAGGWANGGDQTVWDLDYRDQKLLSCASDGLVRLYSFTSPFKSPSAPTHVYKEKQFLSTTVRWVSSNTFLSGCSGVGRAMLWDLNGKVCAKYVYENGKGKQYIQINKIGYCNLRKQVVLACEDNTTRIYSTSTSSPIHSISTPSSPSTLTIQDHLLVLATHASSIHIYDMRRWQQLSELQCCHQSKYDMGIGGVAFVGDTLISAGADGVIKGWK